MRRIKVVQIITKLELGGAQQVAIFLASHLNKERFITYLVSGKEGLLVDEARSLMGERAYFLKDLVREIDPLKDTKAVLQISRILKIILGKEMGPCIVHTHSSKAGILGRWAARISGIPISIHTYHGFGFTDYQSFPVRRFFILLERINAPLASAFICVSRANIEKGRRLRIFARRPVFLIRAGIPIEEFRDVILDIEEFRQSWGIARDGPVVGTVSCFKPQKAPIDFVRMAARVKKEIPNSRFIMVGDGVLRPEVERIAKGLGISDSLILAGWRRDVAKIMRLFDIFVLTSLWEGLPMVFPQAMAAGLPLVATSVDGAPEAIRDGINGFLVPPGDIEAMANKVIQLIRDEKMRKEMGMKGLDYIDEFDRWKMLKAHEDLYQRLLKDRGLI
jgi:glycosyltransferase involved in cell wall biosynthesis